MQKAKQNYFKDRSIFYSTFPIRDQALTGDWSFELKVVYTVGILDFVFAEDKNDTNYYHHEVKLMDTHKKEVFYDKLTFIYLEMPKFNKTEEELESRFDKWLYVLKNLPRLERRPAKLQERVFENLFKTAEIARFTSKEMNAYEDSLKVYRDLRNVMDTAKEESFKEGVEIGIMEGEKNKTVQIVIESSKAGLPVVTIAAITGLPEAEVVLILQQYNMK
jgi:predicted transposase/invertase (TIGR01784 family)